MYVLEGYGYEFKKYYFVLDDNQNEEEAREKIKKGEMSPFGSHIMEHGMGQIVRRSLEELHQKAKNDAKGSL